MTREMMNRIKERKQRAAELVQYANPKSRKRPTMERIIEIMEWHIPYCGEKPVITDISVTEYHKNSIIEVAYFKANTADGRTFEITAYKNLKGRTPEEKEADRTATFPSGLFTIFYKEIIK